MTTFSDVELLAEALASISAEAQARLEKVMRRALNLPEEERLALYQEILPTLVEDYAKAASAAGSDWYDAMRMRDTGSGYRSRPRTDETKKQVDEYAQYDLKYTLPHHDAEDVLRWVLQEVDVLVKNAGRLQVLRSAYADPLPTWYARVPTGTHTCAFCLMLCSKGWTRLPKSAISDFEDKYAGGLAGFHADCDCQIVTAFTRRKPRLQGYDDKQLKKVYDEAVRHSEELTPSEITKAIRRLHPEMVTDGVDAEPGWKSEARRKARAAERERKAEKEFKAARKAALEASYKRDLSPSEYSVLTDNQQKSYLSRRSTRLRVVFRELEQSKADAARVARAKAAWESAAEKYAAKAAELKRKKKT